MSIRDALQPGGPLAPFTQFRRFIVWKKEWDDTKDPPGWAKRPASHITGNITNAHDELVQTDWETACVAAEVFGPPYGVGFVFNEADGFFFLDIDKCLGEQGWSPLAQQLVAAFPGAYVEVSVSGKGLHVFGRGEVPPHKNKNVPLGLEFYTHKRFCALTGTNAMGSADKDCGPQLKWLVDNYFPKTGQDAEFIWTDLAVPVEQDAALLAKMRGSKSAGATFGQKATFDDLWTANAPVLAHNFPAEGRPYDASSADMALFAHLAFWTRKDCARMWRLAWASALVRDKWHDRPEYVRDTLLSACARQKEVYEHERAPAVQGLPPPGAPQGISNDDGYVPVAKHLTTDQANAKRIFDHFGGRILFSEGKWYGWNGKLWEPQEKEAWKCAQQLSDIVDNEAAEWKLKAEAKRAAADPLMGAIEDQCHEALKKHSIKCESKASKEAALGELEKLLSVDIESLDKDIWLINCNNGIVDLRDGTLHPHDPALRMTKICPVDYVPTATCTNFEAFLFKIMQQNPVLPPFIQRWFGYSATGSVREQKFAVHHGEGSNGKGTLMNAIQDVFGKAYAGACPDGMLTATKGENRHPTEVADLRGMRLATSSEGKENETLREDFIKRATGGDRLKARFMRMDFFEFAPTHKLQLFTNHRPRINGTDYAIWRRVMLIPYLVKFGTEEELAAGRVQYLKDETLVEGGFKGEREGIFAWIVRGAMDWYANGLRPPAEVIDATAAYKNEEDNIGQFVAECCEVGADYQVIFNGEGFVDALYPRYVAWVKANGGLPMHARRLTKELPRVVPAYRTSESTKKSEVNNRTVKILVIHGIR